MRKKIFATGEMAKELQKEAMAIWRMGSNEENFEGMEKIIVTPGLVELGEIEYESNYNLAAAAADCCDYMIFVGKERAVPMLKAAEDKGFAQEKIMVVESFAQAVDALKQIASRETVVLVENDLPDVYK